LISRTSGASPLLRVREGEIAATQALNADTARLYGYCRFLGFVVAHRYGVLVVALVRTSLRLRVAGILYALSAPLFIWRGQVDLIRLRQALAGLLLTFAAVIIAVRLPSEAS
jgi:hypothetical protein